MAEEKNRAERNRTLTISQNEINSLKTMISTTKDLNNDSSVENKIFNGDILETLRIMQDSFADLIIIDPPYNLSKNFNGTKFNSMKDADYEAYVDSWLPEVCKKLKPNGSLYLCGDWKCTSVLQRRGKIGRAHV